ncbi:hypothetical protein LZ31DRAFT_597150 [Colletotrichum somersetense]|nr:hypothetical protein LZ31DRAFT_597150 [Colletotrichum somersetense]
MYNALIGLDGSGQVNLSIAAKVTVTLPFIKAVTALFFVGPILVLVGSKIAFLIGGWTHTRDSLDRANGSLVIANGAIFGIGSSLIWIIQVAIMKA